MSWLIIPYLCAWFCLAVCIWRVRMPASHKSVTIAVFRKIPKRKITKQSTRPTCSKCCSLLLLAGTDLALLLAQFWRLNHIIFDNSSLKTFAVCKDGTFGSIKGVNDTNGFGRTSIGKQTVLMLLLLLCSSFSMDGKAARTHAWHRISTLVIQECSCTLALLDLIFAPQWKACMTLPWRELCQITWGHNDTVIFYFYWRIIKYWIVFERFNWLYRSWQHVTVMATLAAAAGACFAGFGFGIAFAKKYVATQMLFNDW